MLDRKKEEEKLDREKLTSFDASTSFIFSRLMYTQQNQKRVFLLNIRYNFPSLSVYYLFFYYYRPNIGSGTVFIFLSSTIGIQRKILIYFDSRYYGQVVYGEGVYIGDWNKATGESKEIYDRKTKEDEKGQSYRFLRASFHGDSGRADRADDQFLLGVCLSSYVIRLLLVFHTHTHRFSRTLSFFYPWFNGC